MPRPGKFFSRPVRYAAGVGVVLGGGAAYWGAVLGSAFGPVGILAGSFVGDVVAGTAGVAILGLIGGAAAGGGVEIIVDKRRRARAQEDVGLQNVVVASVPSRINQTIGIPMDRHCLVHLVYTGNPPGHSAIIVERLTAAGGISLVKMDICAHIASEETGVLRAVEVFREGYITRVRKREIVVDVSRRYRVNHSWEVGPERVDLLYEAVDRDAIRTALAFAKLFLVADDVAYAAGDDFFENHTTLSERFVSLRGGSTFLTQFLHKCVDVAACLDPDFIVPLRFSMPARLQGTSTRVAGDFLDFLYAQDFVAFTNDALRYIKSSYPECLQDAGFIPYRMTGPTLTGVDLRAVADPDDPVNCTDWCKRKLIDAEIASSLFNINKPKKGGYGLKG